jgi:hypothetical protein
VIHRKLENVVYMKKNRYSKKKEKRKRGDGNIGSYPHVPVIAFIKKYIRLQWNRDFQPFRST